MGRHSIFPLTMSLPERGRVWRSSPLLLSLRLSTQWVLYVAFGTIRRDFPDVSAAALSWILSGYTIVIAAGMIG